MPASHAGPTSLLQLDQLPAFPYSRWAWLATLAAAIYRGMPAQVGGLAAAPAWLSSKGALLFCAF